MYNTECLVFLTKIEFCDPCDTYAPAECYLPSIITKAKCHFQILELIMSITIFLYYEYTYNLGLPQLFKMIFYLERILGDDLKDQVCFLNLNLSSLINS